jgi:uncharacterized protein
MPDTLTMPVTDNADAQRYELVVDGKTVFADYSLSDDTLRIHYVEAPPELRGSGAAGRLMEGVAQIAKDNDWRIVPICGYAAAWLRRHKEYHSLLR